MLNLDLTESETMIAINLLRTALCHELMELKIASITQDPKLPDGNFWQKKYKKVESILDKIENHPIYKNYF